MKVILKCLEGKAASAEVNEDTLIIDLKRQVEKCLKIPIPQQTLIVSGSPLQDLKKIGDYPKVKEGTKIYVLIKKPKNYNVELQEALEKVLIGFYTKEHSNRISHNFMENIHSKINGLSLDDLERMAISNLEN